MKPSERSVDKLKPIRFDFPENLMLTNKQKKYIVGCFMEYEAALEEAILEERIACAKLCEVQHLDEKHWTLPSHPKLSSIGLDGYVGAILRDRAAAIRNRSQIL